MSVSQLADLHAAALPDNFHDSTRSPSPDGIDMHDVLSGETSLDLSHATSRGNFAGLLSIDEGQPTWRARVWTHDYRTRRDRTLRRTDGFARQMSSIVEAYMTWIVEMGDNPYTGTSRIKVLDMFQTRTATIEHTEGDSFISTAIIRHGLIPCAPYSPSAAFTIRTLEFYRVSSNRSSGLSIHAFMQSICDQHSTPFKPYISRQFSICFDLYLEIRTAVSKRVQIALQRNTNPTSSTPSTATTFSSERLFLDLRQVTEHLSPLLVPPLN